MTLADFLKRTPLNQVFEKFPALYTVNASDSVGAVGRILTQHHIYSVPVVEDGRVLGMLDLTDLMAYLVYLCKDESGQISEARKNEIAHDPDAFGQAFFSATAKQLINYSGTNPYTPINVNASLYEVADRLTHGTKRLPLVDDSGAILTVVSPSLLVQYLAHHINEPSLQAVVQHKVNSIPSRHVITAHGGDSVLDCVIKMVQHNVSSLGIVEDGVLYSTLSAKDLSSLNQPEQFGRLFIPVDSWISEIRIHTLKAIYPAIHCNVNDTIEKVLLRLAATRIHRLYIVDEAKHPVSVVSLRDLLQLFVQ